MNCPKYLKNVLLYIDIGGNVFIGGILAILIKNHVPALGNAHFTCSEAWAEMRDLHLKGQPIWMYKEGCVACHILTFIQNVILRIPGDHCSESMAGMPTDIESG